jgi:hypothetical protein
MEGMVSYTQAAVKPGDEGTGSDIAGDGKEDHVVASGGDHRNQRPADAALAGTR